MFSTEKSSVGNCDNKDERIAFSGSAVVVTKEGMASDEVASAVAAVSDEIGDILKDELGDSSKADRIGVDLADLSAELGLLAGFADGAQQADFPTLLEMAMAHHRDSGSGSSTGSTWSGGQNNTRRQIRNRPRRRPIQKGKEISARRAGVVRKVVKRCESEVSDVGDTDDSDMDQWTELEDSCSSESSSKEENASANIDCNGYKRKQKPEVEMGQFLLPLLNADDEPPSSEHFLIRHEDILQLLASAEDCVRNEIHESLPKEAALDQSEPDSPNSIEDEAALLNYMCTAAGELSSLPAPSPQPLPDWLMGVYHYWCEVAALIRTMLTNVVPSSVSATDEWQYRAQFPCHCALCLSVCESVALHYLLHTLLVRLGEDSECCSAAGMLVRCLNVSSASAPLQPATWDLPRARSIPFNERAATIIHESLISWSGINDFSRQLAEKICLCVPYDKPMEKEHAVDRFLKILENFKAASNTVFKIEMIFPSETKQQYLDRGSTIDRLNDMRLRTSESEVNAWSDYGHRCDCLNPKVLTAEHRKKLIRMSIVSMMQEIDEKDVPTAAVEGDIDSSKDVNADGLHQEDVANTKPPDVDEASATEMQDDRSEYFTTGDMDDESSSSLSWSSCGSGGELARTVRSLMRNVGEIQRLMDRVMARWPDSDRKKVDVGLSEVDRKLTAMYMRLPDVHRKQLNVYKKQKKLSTVCGRVYGSPPSPPVPGPAPPVPPATATLHNFHEVRRKVMHMRDQQLYYHRLRIWLEDQLKHEGEKSIPESNVTLIDDLPRRKKSESHKSKPITGQKRKYRHLNPSPNTTHKILQLLKQKAPPQTMKLLTDDIDDTNDNDKPVNEVSDVNEVEVSDKNEVNEPNENEVNEINPPEAFVIDKHSESDSDTIIADRDDMCNEIKDCLAKFSSFCIKSDDLPESISPPLQEAPPTENQSLPICNIQRMITINKFLENVVPVPKSVDDRNELCNVYLRYKYASFGMKIKKAMDECQNLINNYNTKDSEKEGQMSIDQICDVMMNLDTNSVELFEKMSDENADADGTKLAEIVQNMPQILANVPEISNKLSEFVNASFELPEFASIMSSLPDLNETQLTPETLKQIRELKLNKNREAKVTKNTSKRKIVVKKSKINDSDAVDRESKYELSARDAEISKIASTLFDTSIKQVNSMKDLRDMIKSRVDNWKGYIASKIKSVPYEVFDNEITAMLDKFYADIHELALKDFDYDQSRLIIKVESWAHPAYLEAMKNFPPFLKIETLMIFDFYIMYYLDIDLESRTMAKASNIKYIDIMKRCIEAPCLLRWMHEQTSLFVKTMVEITDLKLDENFVKNNAKKQETPHECVRELNAAYVRSLDKNSYSRDEWLITLYKLEVIEEEVKKYKTNVKVEYSTREAEIVAGKGLSKLINASSKKSNETPSDKEKTEDKATQAVFLQKFKAILKAAGHLENCATIKSLIDQGLPVPENWKEQVLALAPNAKEKLFGPDNKETAKDVNQLLETYVKLDNIAMKNAKQTLNSVAFKNMAFQSHSESDTASEKKTDVQKTTSSEKEAEEKSVENSSDQKSDSNAKTEPKTKPVAKTKPMIHVKSCETAGHAQHICKVDLDNNDISQGEEDEYLIILDRRLTSRKHTWNKLGHTTGGGSGSGGGANCGVDCDQPCSCCYCTVFGHAPPVTTPVPRNFNETRERLRSILNKKKQKCKTTSSEPEPAAEVKKPQAIPAPAVSVEPPPQPQNVPKPASNVQPQQKPQPLVPPPAPKCDTTQLIDKMANITMADAADKPSQRTSGRTFVSTAEAQAQFKANSQAMEQARQQALRAQHQQQLYHQQLRAQQADRGRSNGRSVSSRDSSVFSTSSGCSGGSWCGGSDPRDLEALLQYIEGPAPTHLRAKKRAKKQRQRAKKLESRLIEERAVLMSELQTARAIASEKCVRHVTIKKRVEESRAVLKQQQYKKGKKQKVPPTQQAKLQIVAEQLGELTTLMNTAAKELRESELKVSDLSSRVRRCEAELNRARESLGHTQQKPSQMAKSQQQNARSTVGPQVTAAQIEMQRAAQVTRQQIEMQRRSQLAASQMEMQRGPQVMQQQTEMQRGSQATQQQTEMQKSQQNMREQMEMQRQLHLYEQRKQREGQGAIMLKDIEGGMVRVVRATGPGSIPGEVHIRHFMPHLTQPVFLPRAPAPVETKSDDSKKQTWEQALAHMNQLVKTQNKEKKKNKQETKPPPKAQKQPQQQPQNLQRSQSLTDTQNLSKKQRKQLAKQLEEQEALKKKQEELKQEMKGKKENKKSQDEKKESKQESKTKEEKKGKENKGEKNAQVNNKQQLQQTKQQQPKTKKEKKKEKEKQNKPQVINITPDTTCEAFNKQVPCSAESDKAASCSIMEQLSCGVQVSDLKLPPGITLTRVQPNEKKEPPAIKSVPIWKCSLLSSAPTPEARPQPVISADPGARHFAPAHPEPPSSIIIPETQPPQPPQPGKSKKAKKKAKKAADAQPQPEPTKMVTLRNPMFHPNLPPIQINSNANSPAANINAKKPELRPEPAPIPQSACQATITPTSNGMFTIRNPLMSMMYQQQQAAPVNQYYNYEPNMYENEANLNLASFAQSNEEEYSLFNKSEDKQPFLNTDSFYQENKSNVSPIGTRPNDRFADNSLFTNNVIPRPEQKKEDYGLYTPFGVEHNDLFRHALFDRREEERERDELPYFQRLRVGTKLNQEVSVHSVSESKFFKPDCVSEATFSTPWSPRYSPHYKPPTPDSRDGYGPVAPPTRNTDNQSMFSANDLSSVEAMRYDQLYMQRNKLSH